MAETLPSDVIERAETLTRRLRNATDDDERKAYAEARDALVAEHGYTARIREEGDRAVLVLYPDEWLEDGTVRVDRIDDTSRAVERPLSGVGDGDWEAVEAYNRAVATRVAEEYGSVHGATAHAFADFMSNHYAKRVDGATRREREEFETDYFVRNAWPTAEQYASIERSLELVFETAEASE